VRYAYAKIYNIYMCDSREWSGGRVSGAEEEVSLGQLVIPFTVQNCVVALRAGEGLEEGK